MIYEPIGLKVVSIKKNKENNMNIIFEKKYKFKVSQANLEEIHTDMANMLNILPGSLYDDFLICIHELIINSIAEIRKTNHKKDLITINLFLTEEGAILCLKDFGRGISKEQLEKEEDDPLKEHGRGLDIIMMLSDWFCIYSEGDCYSYYIVKNI